jgi:predicted RNA-binding protein YlqC (UPF0109 family)
MRRKIEIEAMGKNIIIDEPTLIKITCQEPESEPFHLKVRINNESMGRLKAAMRRSGSDL